jgi:hypothetical protein
MKAMIGESLPENNSFAIVKVSKDGDISIDGFYNCEDRLMKK